MAVTMEEAGRGWVKWATAMAVDVTAEVMVKARAAAETAEVLMAAAMALESAGWAVVEAMAQALMVGVVME